MTVERPAHSRSWLVYRVTNTVNGQSYIGITRRSLEIRWYCHVHGPDRGASDRTLQSAILEYGERSFIKEVLFDNLSYDDAVSRERSLIISTGSRYPGGYNCTAGGELGRPEPGLDDSRNDAPPFRLWRERLGITQGQAARRLGMTLGAIRNYDQGRKALRKPYILAMIAIEDGFTADDLGKVPK